jgi:exosortase
MRQRQTHYLGGHHPCAILAGMNPLTHEAERTPAPLGVWLLSLALLLAAFFPTLRWLVITWLGSPYYGHGILVPLIAGWSAWRLSRGRDGAPSAAFWPGAGVLAAALAAHLGALGRGQHLLSALALVVGLGGLVMALGGLATLRRMAFPLAYLLLMIPLPWMEASTPALARGVARWAAALARPVGVQAAVEGARVSLAGGAMTVGAPCSGLNSLGALVALAALYAFLLRGPLWARATLVALSPAIALAANLARIWLLLVLGHYVSIPFALRYFHDWSGFLLFLLALGLLIAIGKGMGCREIRADI